ncbi:putative photosystem I PsaA/PsaB [Helianthus annuus]|nr:putative photosystem I PsaA/PsaB [Helianthus annuus]KAJ0738016.1 putative photosystem I PsaA/PsaB [Helianthus annuus]
MAHHHLAIVFIFLIVGHMCRTNFGIGHSIKDLLDAHIPPGWRSGRERKGLYDTINNLINFQLGLALASLGVITSLIAQHMYSIPACETSRSYTIDTTTITNISPKKPRHYHNHYHLYYQTTTLVII